MKTLSSIALLSIFLLACQAKSTPTGDAPAVFKDTLENHAFIPPMAGFFASVSAVVTPTDAPELGFEIKPETQELYRAWYTAYYSWKMAHWHPRHGNDGSAPWPPQLTADGSSFQIDDMRFRISETLVTFRADLAQFLAHHWAEMDEETAQIATQLMDLLS